MDREQSVQFTPAGDRIEAAGVAGKVAPGQWRDLPRCPGRAIWTGADDLSPSDLLAPGVVVRVFEVPAAPDPVHVAAFADGGGLISYEKGSGRFVHTRNTAEGFARKLAQLGISLDRD